MCIFYVVRLYTWLLIFSIQKSKCTPYALAAFSHVLSVFRENQYLWKWSLCDREHFFHRFMKFAVSWDISLCYHSKMPFINKMKKRILSTALTALTLNEHGMSAAPCPLEACLVTYDLKMWGCSCCCSLLLTPRVQSSQNAFWFLLFDPR